MFNIQNFIIHMYASALEFLIIYFLFSRYKKPIPKVNKNIIIIIILLALIQAFFASFDYFIINVSASAILYLVVSLLFFKQWQDILYSWIIATAVIDIGEGLASMSITTISVTGREIDVFLSNSINAIILYTLARLISFLLIVFILKFRKINGSKINLPTIYWLTFLFITMKDILWILLISRFTQKISFFYWAAVVPLMPVSYILFYYTRRSIENMIKNRVESKIIDEKNKYYEQQLITIKQTLETQKIVRHDLKNKLSPIIYLAQKGNQEELISYIKKLDALSVLGKIYADSGNLAMDYIINLKLQTLANKGVEISCDINVPNDLEILPFDLSTILGNLLDNATEALEFVKSNKWISIQIRYSVGILILQVINAFDGSIYLENDTIISRKSNLENHGFGLRSVRTIAEQYNGEFIVHYDEKKFEATVKILS